MLRAQPVVARWTYSIVNLRAELPPFYRRIRIRGNWHSSLSRGDGIEIVVSFRVMSKPLT